MKQTDSDKIREGQEILAVLKEQRGGAILPIHKKMANDPKLLQAFSQQFKICKQEISHIPPQYMELMLMMMGAAAGNAVTIREHGQLALKKGATPDEVGEALRLIFFYFGASALILGSVADYLINSPQFGWRFAYRAVGISLGVVLCLEALILRKAPEADQTETKSDSPVYDLQGRKVAIPGKGLYIKDSKIITNK